MKARIKKTGELINIAPYAKIILETCDSWGNPIEVSPEEIELVHDDVKTDNTPDHWQDVRERAAIAAIQGVMNSIEAIDCDRETIAEMAVKQADALVERLKGE